MSVSYIYRHWGEKWHEERVLGQMAGMVEVMMVGLVARVMRQIYRLQQNIWVPYEENTQLSRLSIVREMCVNAETPTRTHQTIRLVR